MQPKWEAEFKEMKKKQTNKMLYKFLTINVSIARVLSSDTKLLFNCKYFPEENYKFTAFFKLTRWNGLICLSNSNKKEPVYNLTVQR